MGRKARTVFTLKSLDLKGLLSFYLEKDDNSGYITLLEDEFPSENRVRTRRRGRKPVEFKDIHKKVIKYWPNMVDNSQNSILPQYTTQRCHMCHNTFTSRVLGCPIDYKIQDENSLEKDYIKNYFSSLNFTLTEGTDYFITEGVFCSCNCVKEYILMKLSIHGSAKYYNSLTLLTLMKKKIFGEEKFVFTPCMNRIKTLKDYGGHLTIKEYRSVPDYQVYLDTVNMKRPCMFSCSEYIEERKLK